ncbi:hypothetical protein HCH17_13425 [Klebsiella aerogenes]|uniref:hypothetical protein n=1 Tax=Enterobacteriaceae TaxID=543 RepID=UPI0010BA0FF9|nr:MULTISPECIES: hypothetical protein [Enterobacteriaceae]EKS6736017.1 hypothetical protein [Enterobacter asburiae]EJA1203318.1 hypothetical protein [Escherichia coli]MBX8999689.1 hypothetical protein [Klebsiella aerogenes]GCL19525.1 hypothetical protein BvCmsE55A_02437 [Escherichia coli]HAN4501751.1 hypothetical protein [Escherichia coli]
MAKHLNRSEIKAIKHIILTWDGKITWSDLCESVYKNLNRTITRQSLSAHDEVVEAYRTKKSLSNLKKAGLKKPANLTIAAQQIINLKAENEMLKKQNNRYKEQFSYWQYNAYRHGLTMEQLNRPFNKK